MGGLLCSLGFLMLVADNDEDDDDELQVICCCLSCVRLSVLEIII